VFFFAAARDVRRENATRVAFNFSGKLADPNQDMACLH
jgi:hypothetical protein